MSIDLDPVTADVGGRRGWPHDRSRPHALALVGSTREWNEPSERDATEDGFLYSLHEVSVLSARYGTTG